VLQLLLDGKDRREISEDGARRRFGLNYFFIFLFQGL
jgi:hypothetical protein